MRANGCLRMTAPSCGGIEIEARGSGMGLEAERGEEEVDSWLLMTKTLHLRRVSSVRLLSRARQRDPTQIGCFQRTKAWK